MSSGCDLCYAESLDNQRFGGTHWGAGADRRVMSDGYWRQPAAWNRKAVKSGEPWRVFCSSLADVFDAEAPDGQRDRLWQTIRETPALTWMLLTKRPHLIRRCLPDDWGTGWPNVWLGTSVENQETADERIPWLLKTPAAVRFISAEPLLGPVDVNKLETLCYTWRRGLTVGTYLDWVIAGGESGPGARPCHPDWARSLRDQCAAAAVPFFFKQWGEHYPADAVKYLGDDRREVIWDSRIVGKEPRKTVIANDWVFFHVGKKAAGDLLDGVRHHEFPAA